MLNNGHDGLITYVMATEAAKQYKKQNENINKSDYLLEEDLLKNIRKRKDGRWEMRKMVDGKRISVISKNINIVRKKFSEIVKTKLMLTEKVKSNINLHSYALSWAETYKKPFVKEKPYKDIVRNINSIENTSIDIPVKNLTTRILQEYFNTIETSRTKELTILYINAAIKRAVREDLLKHNPMDDLIKPPKIDKIRSPFTYDEQVKVLNAVKGTSIEPYVLIYLYTGIRKNEFKIKHIKEDIEGTVLRVECEKKRNKEPVYRFVDLTEKTIQLIKTANLTMSIEKASDEFRLVLDELNIPKGYGFHTLRHTFTTNHFYLGTPEKFLQEWLGHEKIETTKKHYMSIDRTLSKEKIMQLHGDYYYVIK